MEGDAIDLQLENDLKALFEAETPKSAPATGAESGEDTQSKPDNKQDGVPPPTPPADETSDASDESGEELSDKDKVFKALDELDKPEEPKKEGEQQQAPALTEEQQIILKHIPDAQSAETLVQIANNHVAFEQAFGGGDFELVDKMFGAWNQQAYDAFMEHIYQKHVATGEWVERFVGEKDAEKNGNSHQFRVQSKLEKEIAELKKVVQGRTQQEAQARAQAAERQVFTNYNAELDKLFTKVGITDETDKKYIKSAINAEVAGNAKLVADIRKGDYKGLTQTFKNNSNAYLKRDAHFASKTDSKIQGQNQHKPPISGGAGAPSSNSMPDNVKDVPKGKEDAWLSQTLGNFFASKKKK